MFESLSLGFVHFSNILQAGGALDFVVAILGWYMLVVIMMAEMRWTVNLPVGDLTHYWHKTDIEIAAMENEKKD